MISVSARSVELVIVCIIVCLIVENVACVIFVLVRRHHGIFSRHHGIESRHDVWGCHWWGWGDSGQGHRLGYGGGLGYRSWHGLCRTHLISLWLSVSRDTVQGFIIKFNFCKGYDIFQFLQIIAVIKCHTRSGLASSSCSSRAMDVVLGIFWRLHLNYKFDVWNVNSTRSNICCN